MFNSILRVEDGMVVWVENNPSVCMYWWLTLVMAGLTGSCDFLPQPHILREDCSAYHWPREKIIISNSKYTFN